MVQFILHYLDVLHFTKLTPTVHLDMIYQCHMVVCVLDLHFTLEWPWLGRSGCIYYSTFASFSKLTPTVHLDMIYQCHVVVCVLDLHFTLEWPWLGRNGCLYYNTCASFTKLTPTVHLDMSAPMSWGCHEVVCPTFHAWVAMARKKMFNSILQCECYIHLTYMNCSYWHDVPMTWGSLCPWPTFHARLIMVRKKCLMFIRVCYIMTVTAYYIHQTWTYCSSWRWMYPCHVVVCAHDLYFTLEWLVR